MTKESAGFAYFIGILGAITWGISFIGTKTGLDYLEPIQVMAVRSTIAIITFIIFIGIGAIKVNFKGKNMKALFILSITQPCLYSIFEIIGIDLTTASESAILLSIVPVAVTVIYIFAFKEKVGGLLIGFILLSFAGVIVTVIGDITTSGKIIGYVSLMIAVMLAATYTILSKRISGKFTTMEITFIMTCSGFVFFNAINFVMGYGIGAYKIIFVNSDLLISMLFLGIFCSVFAFIAYNNLINKVPAYKASTVSLSVLTITGVIAGILLRNDPVTIYKILGLAMILTGVIGASRPEKKRVYMRGERT